MRVILVGCWMALCLPAASAAGAAWEIRFNLLGYRMDNEPSRIRLGVATSDPPADQGTLASADGLVARSFGGSGSSTDQHYYSDFASLRAATTGAAAPWTWTSTNAGATSVYHFAADFSAIAASDLALAQTSTPTPGQVLTQKRPTFTWTAPSGVTNDGFAYVLWSGGQLTQPIGGNGGSWTPNQDLLSRQYQLDVQYFGLRTTVPLQWEWVSGPTLPNLPADARFAYESENVTSFSVDAPVPEPAIVGIVSAGTVWALSIRRRRRAGSRASSPPPPP